MAIIIIPEVMPFWEGGAPISAASRANGAFTTSVSNHSFKISSGEVTIVRMKSIAFLGLPATLKTFCRLLKS